MKVALYVGDHRDDGLLNRLGCALTRLVQKGAYGHVTHVEAVLEERADGTVTIASSSLRDGGVRVKTTPLQRQNWIVAEVPMWCAAGAAAWFAQHAGEGYDTRGAVATVLPGHRRSGEWFCNEAVGAAVGVLEPHTFTPAQFAAIALTLGRDVTEEFFAQKAGS